jgi:hypothetical protein
VGGISVAEEGEEGEDRKDLLFLGYKKVFGRGGNLEVLNWSFCFCFLDDQRYVYEMGWKGIGFSRSRALSRDLFLPRQP